jgi:hypothetical protein
VQDCQIAPRAHHSLADRRPVKGAEARGFSLTQAEGITEALKELDVSMLATKADLKDLELRLYKFLAGVLIAHGLGTAALTVVLLQLPS